ncbi:hypothetical protein, partial [Methylobacterium sp. WL7]|uniref:hypothetical protein n=1 Tax=Methylobacterium sp. WL7 TaxID=2603900 RepID=UPI001AEEA84B
KTQAAVYRARTPDQRPCRNRQGSGKSNTLKGLGLGPFESMIVRAAAAVASPPLPRDNAGKLLR